MGLSDEEYIAERAALDSKKESSLFEQAILNEDENTKGDSIYNIHIKKRDTFDESLRKGTADFQYLEAYELDKEWEENRSEERKVFLERKGLLQTPKEKSLIEEVIFGEYMNK